MSITRAQIARELYIKGGVVNPDGRRGFAGGAGMGESDRGYQGGGRDTKGSVSGSAPGAGSSHRSNTPSGADDRSTPTQTINHLRNQNRYVAEDEDLLPGDTSVEDVDVPLTEREKNEKENRNLFINKEANYSTYTPSYVKFLGDLNRQPNRKFFYERVLKNNAVGLNYTQLEEEYDKYMSNRLAGYTDAMGNTDPNYRKEGDQYFQIDAGRGGDNTIPQILPMDDLDDTEEEVNPRDYTGLAPRFMGSSFDFTGLAEGGRVAAQQGGIMSQQGGIMPRLSDLSGDVSSAEQMLQEINQRLQSAESTLGEGGGMRGTTIAPNMSPLENAMRSQQPLGQPGLASIANYTPFAGETFSQVPEQFRSGFDEYKKENPIGIGGQAISYSMLPDGNRVSFGDTASASGFSDYLNSIGQPNNTYQGMEGFAPQPGGPMQSALQSPLAGAIRQGAMDGGRMRQMEMMEDEDDPTGGIMDLESGRQMYFLGKLVKKAGRAIKKVVKSPIGKAALLYFGGNALMGKMGGLSGLKGSLFGTAGGTARMTPGILGKLGITGGGGAMMPTLKGGLSLGLGIPFALDALGVGKEEEDGIDLDAYYKTQGIDIDAIRNNPNRILARRFVGMADGGRINYQEGGDAEPVAKKTMPLLDMDGKEMDLRAEGGFVPLGRMERADDVPARLSKNEFVFTADAVRNAGEGDIDKGAEVMYNMMKNLESGGEVSEESQGLDGAREMFKTSQRLEEVL